MRGRDAVKLHGSLEERPHLREVAERDVVLALRVAKWAAERVRVVRPDVELNLRRARRVRVLPLRKAEERPHEGEGSLSDERLREVLERIEATSDDEVRGIDSVHRNRKRVHHP